MADDERLLRVVDEGRSLPIPQQEVSTTPASVSLRKSVRRHERPGWLATMSKRVT